MTLASSEAERILPIANATAVVCSLPAARDHALPSGRSVLVIDIGGSKVKLLAEGENKAHKSASGPDFTPERLLSLVHSLKSHRKYGGVSIGYPGLVGASGPISEPGKLGSGWVAFDYASAFGVPVKIVNDAVMQAMGSYDGGRMVFLGLGTGIGSAFIAEDSVVSLELSHLRYDSKRTVNDVLSRAGLRRLGKKRWRRCIGDVVPMLIRAFTADYLVLGGGNAKYINDLPAGARLGHNRAAFRGGIRLWEERADR
jgi:polyphosphate glucokinase